MRLVSFDHKGTAGFGAMVGNDGIVDLGSRLAGVADLRAMLAQDRTAEASDIVAGASGISPADVTLERRFPIRENLLYRRELHEPERRVQRQLRRPKVPQPICAHAGYSGRPRSAHFATE